MTQRIGGSRRKTRHQLTKGYRKKGKISLPKYFSQFEKGQKVVIKPEPSFPKNICHKRFFGKMAIINKKQGDCYEIIMASQNQKKLIVHPVHLAKV